MAEINLNFTGSPNRGGAGEGGGGFLFFCFCQKVGRNREVRANIILNIFAGSAQRKRIKT